MRLMIEGCILGLLLTVADPMLPDPPPPAPAAEVGDDVVLPAGEGVATPIVIVPVPITEPVR